MIDHALIVTFVLGRRPSSSARIGCSSCARSSDEREPLRKRLKQRRDDRRPRSSATAEATAEAERRRRARRAAGGAGRVVGPAAADRSTQSGLKVTVGVVFLASGCLRRRRLLSS